MSVKSWQHNYRGGIVPDDALDALTVSEFSEHFRNQQARTGSDTWLAEREGQVCGFVQFGASRDPDAPQDVAEVYAIFVDPETQGTGAGLLLMERALEALAGSYPEATLWVLELNDQARRFYERGGWQLDGGRKPLVIGGYELPAVRYRRGLR